MKPKEKLNKRKKKKTQSPENKNTRLCDRSKKVFGAVSKERLEDFVDLADTIARLFDSKYLSFEERKQNALIGIAHGLETFEEGKSSETSWLSLKGKYAVLNAIRQEKKRLRNDPTAKQIWFEDELVVAPDNYQSEIGAELDELSNSKTLLQSALSKLDARTRAIVVAVAFRGEKQQEIAARFKISQSWCSRLYKHGLTKMRNYIVSQVGVDF